MWWRKLGFEVSGLAAIVAGCVGLGVAVQRSLFAITLFGARLFEPFLRPEHGALVAVVLVGFASLFALGLGGALMARILASLWKVPDEEPPSFPKDFPFNRKGGGSL
jgi:hypothetical protein